MLANGEKPEMKYCHQASYGNEYLLHFVVEEHAMKLGKEKSLKYSKMYGYQTSKKQENKLGMIA